MTERKPFRHPHLLFVDDEPRVLAGIRRSLHGVEAGWMLGFVNSVDEAINYLDCHAVDVTVTDITMPVRDGFDLLQTITHSPRLSHIPVIVLTGLADTDMKRRALDSGAFDLVAKPIRPEDLIARLRSVLRTKDYQDSLAELNQTLERKVAERTQELEASRTDILICLAMAGECRDTETGHHLIRVARYSRRLAEGVGLPASDIDTIFKASPLHDIGKLGVPDHILLKPGALDSTERALMQTHCKMGHRILSTPAAIAAIFDSTLHCSASNPLLNAAAEIALHHHERWDGSGYPNGIAGPGIPMAARIVAVADVYDALTSHRPYKSAMTHAAAIELQRGEAGRHFDPKIIRVLESISRNFDEIRQMCGDPINTVENTNSSLRSVFMPYSLSA